MLYDKQNRQACQLIHFQKNQDIRLDLRKIKFEKDKLAAILYVLYKMNIWRKPVAKKAT